MSGFRLAPEAEAELDDIWLHIARDSGNIDIATRVVTGLGYRGLAGGKVRICALKQGVQSERDSAAPAKNLVAVPHTSSDDLVGGGRPPVTRAPAPLAKD